MAKKKTEDETSQLSITDFATRIRNEIDKEFGKGICINADAILNKNLKIIPWSKSLNDGIGGGIVEGSWVSIEGQKKHGKSSSALTFAAQAQKFGKTVYYLSVEGRIKKRDLLGIKELDLSDGKFVIIESTVEKILSTQDFLNIAEKIIKTYPGSVIIIDSISALADQKELDGGLGTMTRGHNQQVISQFINNVGQLVTVNKIIVFGIVHLIANTSGFGASKVAKAPNRWFYQTDFILSIKSIDKWRTGGEDSPIIGQIIHWECLTSALTSPFATFDSYLRYGIGLDETYEYLQNAISCGLVSKAGAWYELTFLQNYPEFLVDKAGEMKPPKFQGGENTWEYINSNDKVLEVMKAELAK